ncbi:MAG TPA: hypothetical protein VGJ20_20535 [Xanthobacteraceae bacterium]|jgi:hypothetical protein
MTLHHSTFDYLKPTERQIFQMQELREAFPKFADLIQRALPDGPDKTHVIRLIRTAAMWANVAITREQDGSPREERKPLDPGADAAAFASMDGKR